MAKNTNYVSELDQFINQLFKKNPELIEKQKQLRSTWWDREAIDQAEQELYLQNSAPRHGYAYFDYSTEQNAK